MSGQGTWETTLKARDFDGNVATVEGYYDTVLNITWLGDTLAGAGSIYDNGGSTTDGALTWLNANSWAATLSVNGISGWRLPVTGPVNGTSINASTFGFNGSSDQGYNISAPGSVYPGSTASEMAHLFHVTLGNKSLLTTGGTVQPGNGFTNSGPFSNVQAMAYAGYWSATEYPSDTARAFYFDFSNGSQRLEAKSPTNLYAWAVHSGDVGVSTVPIPATVWLLATSLAGLGGRRWLRRKFTIAG